MNRVAMMLCTHSRRRWRQGSPVPTAMSARTDSTMRSTTGPGDQSKDDEGNGEKCLCRSDPPSPHSLRVPDALSASSGNGTFIYSARRLANACNNVLAHAFASYGASTCIKEALGSLIHVRNIIGSTVRARGCSY